MLYTDYIKNNLNNLKMQKKYPSQMGGSYTSDLNLDQLSKSLQGAEVTLPESLSLFDTEAGTSYLNNPAYQPQGYAGVTTASPSYTQTVAPPLRNVGEQYNNTSLATNPQVPRFTSSQLDQMAKLDKNSKSNFKKGQIYNEMGDYSKTEAARALGISKKELEQRAKAGGFKSTQAYYESLRNQGTQGTQSEPSFNFQDYLGGLLSRIVPDVEAATNDVSGSAVQYGEGSNTQPQQGRNFADIVKSAISAITPNTGNWGTPELGLTEFIGEWTGAYQPQYGSIANAYGSDVANAAQGAFTAAGAANPVNMFRNVANVATDGAYGSRSTVPTFSGNSGATGTPPSQGTVDYFNSEAPSTYTNTPSTNEYFTNNISTSLAEGAEATSEPTATSTDGTGTQTPDVLGTTTNEISSMYPELYGDTDLGTIAGNIIDQVTSGMKSEIEGVKEITAIQEQKLRDTYNYLQENYAIMSDEAKAKADIALNKIQSALDLAYGKADITRGRVKNAYADLIKGTVNQGRVSEQKLRNMFSSLGTAESSAFIENMTNLEQGLGQQIGDIKQQGQFAQDSIDQQLLEIDKNAESQTAEILLNLQMLQRELANNQQLTDAQKATALKELSVETINSITNIINQANEVKMQLPFQIAGLEANLMASMPYQQNPYSTGQALQYDTPPQANFSPAEGAISDDGQWIYKNGQWVRRY